MIIYIEILILALTLINFWEPTLIKDSIIWTIFVGFFLLFKTNQINSQENYLHSILKDSIKGIVVIEFIVNFYSFSLLTELILTPVICFIFIIQFSAQKETRYKLVEKIFSGLISLFGFIIIIYSIIKISQETSSFLNLQTLKSFLLPIILTSLYLPFLYCVALWSLYEITISIASYKIKNKKDKLYLKKKIFMTFLFNRKKLNKFQKEIGYASVLKKEDIDLVIYKFLNQQNL